ncbi:MULTISPECIES: TlpA disulfide reductase family protein [unclassified Sphingobacterium]|uniref:TlpA disulfide reductase family protein n=1 Tax=unclassified Sphingobacterium TaxID=2609468 RepID=UPI00143A971F|nr:TlpA disulfide reductase family protein [Sphingobacterium sp. B16(2022)]NJI72150.1 AhpC/TSA family protein [Sphingobacterium sp. B16(2022)]
MIFKRAVKILAIIFVFITIVTPLFSQRKFDIQGTGKQILDGEIIYLSYRNEGRYILDSTFVKNNSFKFEGIIENIPIRASLYRNQNPTHNYDFIYDRLSLYLEEGIISVQSMDSLNNARISGTAVNNTFQLLQERLALLEKERLSIKDPDYFSEEERKDTALVNKNRSLLEANYYKQFDVQLAFAKEFSNSYVSLDLVNNIARNNKYNHLAEEVFNLLSDSLLQLPKAAVTKESFLNKNKVRIGSIAPEFEMNDRFGRNIKLSNYRGKYLLLDFWASWCLPCRQEHPNLIAVYDDFKGANFDILSVSIDSKKDKWLNAIIEDGLIWSQISDLKASNGEVYQKYGIGTIPCNFLLDPQGKVIAKDLKGQDLTDKIKEVVNIQANMH